MLVLVMVFACASSAFAGVATHTKSSSVNPFAHKFTLTYDSYMSGSTKCVRNCSNPTVALLLYASGVKSWTAPTKKVALIDSNRTYEFSDSVSWITTSGVAMKSNAYVDFTY